MVPSNTNEVSNDNSLNGQDLLGHHEQYLESGVGLPHDLHKMLTCTNSEIKVCSHDYHTMLT